MRQVKLPSFLSSHLNPHNYAHAGVRRGLRVRKRSTGY